jgi:hypothetical protein
MVDDVETVIEFYTTHFGFGLNASAAGLPGTIEPERRK